MFSVECLMFSEERRDIMKTTGIKMNGYRLTVIGLLLGLAITMQAVDYKNTHRGVQSTVSYQPSALSIQSTAPSVGFQSTSAYSGQWNQDAQQSMLNADGTVNAEAYGVGRQHAPGLRKDPTGNPGTPGDDDEEEGEQQPLGDVLWPLMLMAMLYVGARALRARRMRSFKNER